MEMPRIVTLHTNPSMSDKQYIEIVSQDAADRLMSTVPWGDAILYEAHVISPCYMTYEDGRLLQAPGTGGDLSRLLFLLASTTTPAIEFVFWPATAVWLDTVDWAVLEISPNRVRFLFSSDDIPPVGFVTAERVWYRWHDKSRWGPSTLYGREYPFNEEGLPLFLTEDYGS